MITKQKKGKVTVLPLDKVDFRAKNIIRHKKGPFHNDKRVNLPRRHSDLS